ncbi:hypothetical protein FOL47_000645, partial [Perkinsus chesapeaki]
VTLEIVKYFQGRFVSSDEHMKDKGGHRTATSNSSTLIEELGSVTHLFSDKTGTLTENLMIFTNPNPDKHVSAEFDTDTFKKAVMNNNKEDKEDGILLLLGLCLCHSVLIKDTSSSTITSSTTTIGSESLYDASSPDELALVAGARHLGFEFISRPTPDTIRIKLTNEFAKEVININDDIIDVELLEVLEFDNDRKRMSVLIKILTHNKYGSISHPLDGRTLLLIKGADSSMIEVSEGKEGGSNDELEGVLDVLAADGLRTLVYGIRDLTNDNIFIEGWRKDYNNIRGMIGGNDKDKALRECINNIERDIHIVGCTGIEDKLQDYVSETISDLQEAGIKIWVLTGDKIETAINIALLIDSDNITTTMPGGGAVISSLKGFGFDEVSRVDRIGKYRSSIDIPLQDYIENSTDEVVAPIAEDRSDKDKVVISKGASTTRDGGQQGGGGGDGRVTLIPVMHGSKHDWIKEVFEALPLDDNAPQYVSVNDGIVRTGDVIGFNDNTGIYEASGDKKDMMLGFDNRHEGVEEEGKPIRPHNMEQEGRGGQPTTEDDEETPFSRDNSEDEERGSMDNDNNEDNIKGGDDNDDVVAAADTTDESGMDYDSGYEDD